MDAVEVGKIEAQVEDGVMNWRRAFHEMVDDLMAQFRRDRYKAGTKGWWMRGREWFLKDCTDAQLDELARWVATDRTEDAINRHNAKERVRKLRAGQAQ